MFKLLSLWLALAASSPSCCLQVGQSDNPDSTSAGLGMTVNSSGGTTGASSGSSTGGGHTCDTAAAPPDAGPMLAFSVNPLSYSSSGSNEIEIVSLSHSTSRFEASLAVSPPDLTCVGGGKDTLYFEGPTDYVIVDCLYPPNVAAPLLSFSANRSGTTLTVQSISGDGGRICTALNEPCGSHGDCCIGLSCQATDGGCSCLYAWPSP